MHAFTHMLWLFVTALVIAKYMGAQTGAIKLTMAGT